MIKKVWINDKMVEVEVSTEEMQIPETPQEQTEIEVLQQQNADLNLQVIDLWETLIGAGVI